MERVTPNPGWANRGWGTPGALEIYRPLNFGNGVSPKFQLGIFKPLDPDLPLKTGRFNGNSVSRKTPFRNEGSG